MAELRGRARMYAKALNQVSKLANLSGAIDRNESQRGARFISFAVRLHDPLQVKRALGLAEELATATNTPVVIARRKGGYVLYQFQLAYAFWESYTRADLPRPTESGVGLADGRRQVNFDFSAPHSGVFGTTGSGKTETVKSILCGLAGSYAPDELQVIIIDMKGKYSEFHNMSHLCGVDIAHTEAEIDRALALVNHTLKIREQTSSFNERRMLVVADESEAVFSTRLRLQIGQALVKRGREVRVNGLFATQEPQKDDFGKYLMGQIEGRWVGRVDNAYTSSRVTGRRGLDAHLLTGAGDFIHLLPGGMCDRLQVALATQTDYDKLPRGNTSPPEFKESDPLDVDLLPDDGSGGEDGSGRPRHEIEPERLAYYIIHRPGNVTQRQAHDDLGLGKLLHYRYREFATRLINEMRRLKGERDGGT